MHWRWREDREPGDPVANMAVDLALLEELEQSEFAKPIVRVYRWDRPAVSIGRLQSEDLVRKAFPGAEIVRRPTGGRAVCHGADLTFSVAARDTDLPDVGDHGVMSSYRQIVAGLISAFRAVDVSAQLGAGERENKSQDTVDCFASVARCDVINAQTGHKLMGCAQRRRGGVILQQMSIPNSMLSDQNRFVAAAKEGFAAALGVGQWSIDTAECV